MDKIYPASAYDLEMFTYRYITEGALVENQKAFFQEKLFSLKYKLAEVILK